MPAILRETAMKDRALDRQDALVLTLGWFTLLLVTLL